eukprot:s250_g20.t3
MNWIIPDKFLAFAGPSPTSTDADGFPAFTPEDYVPIFRDAGIGLVVRLNKKQYLLLTLGSRTFSRDDWESSLEELGVQAGSHLTCVKSTPMSEALPAFVGFAGGMRTSSSSGASKVSLYFELAAEGWRDFPWRGPVDVALQATVGDLWEDAQHILMEVAEAHQQLR